jgi:hypothetical protein
VVKAREGCESSHKKSINAVKQFVFWETNGEYEPTPEDDDRSNRRKRKTNRNSWGDITPPETKKNTLQ